MVHFGMLTNAGLVGSRVHSGRCRRELNISQSSTHPTAFPMPPPTSHARTASGTFISEQLIQDSFHSYLKSSLTQAKLERLLDAEVLSSAEADLMITGVFDGWL